MKPKNRKKKKIINEDGEEVTERGDDDFTERTDEVEKITPADPEAKDKPEGEVIKAEATKEETSDNETPKEEENPEEEGEKEIEEKKQEVSEETANEVEKKQGQKETVETAKDEEQEVKTIEQHQEQQQEATEGAAQVEEDPLQDLQDEEFERQLAMTTPQVADSSLFQCVAGSDTPSSARPREEMDYDYTEVSAEDGEHLHDEAVQKAPVKKKILRKKIVKKTLKKRVSIKETPDDMTERSDASPISPKKVKKKVVKKSLKALLEATEDALESSTTTPKTQKKKLIKKKLLAAALAAKAMDEVDVATEETPKVKKKSLLKNKLLMAAKAAKALEVQEKAAAAAAAENEQDIASAPKPKKKLLIKRKLLAAAKAAQAMEEAKALEASAQGDQMQQPGMKKKILKKKLLAAARAAQAMAAEKEAESEGTVPAPKKKSLAEFLSGGGGGDDDDDDEYTAVDDLTVATATTTATAATAATTSSVSSKKARKKILKKKLLQAASAAKLASAMKDAETKKKKRPSITSNSEEGLQAALTADAESKHPPPQSPMSPTGDGKSDGKSGLSQLAKQLRGLQAKNDRHLNEIARLERQLDIVADSKGLSVLEVRNALETACQEHAHKELQSKIFDLQSQLDYAKSDNDSSGGNLSNEMTKREIATLQLRVGELEEVESSLQTEIRSLYAQLQEKSYKAMTYEAQISQRDIDLAQHEEKIRDHQQDLEMLTVERNQLLQEQDMLETRMRQLTLDLKLQREKTNSLEDQLSLEKKFMLDSSTNINDDEEKVKEVADQSTEQQKIAEQQQKEIAALQQKEIANLYMQIRDQSAEITTLQDKCDQQDIKMQSQKDTIDKQKVTIDDLKAKSNDLDDKHKSLNEDISKLNLSYNVEKDKAQNLLNQLTSKERDMKLYREQTNSRFNMQRQEIEDLKQQVSSLYTAYQMLQNEAGEQQQHTHQTQQDADEQLARTLQEQESSGSAPSPATAEEVPAPTTNPEGDFIDSKPPAHPESPVYMTPSMEQQATQALHGVTPKHQHESFVGEDAIKRKFPTLMEGYMYKYDQKTLLKTWKQRYFVLRGKEHYYQLLYYQTKPHNTTNAAMNNHNTGKVITITMGLSTVKETSDYVLPRHFYAVSQSTPLINSIVLAVNPDDNNAAVLYLAATSQSGLENWMHALNLATQEKSPEEEQDAIDHQLAIQMSRVGCHN